MKPWLSRFDANARVSPSGDQASASALPRTYTDAADTDPLIGAIQRRPPLRKATRCVRGAMTGPSPLPRRLALPSLITIDQTSFGGRTNVSGVEGCVVVLCGTTLRLAPRTKTRYLASSENDRLVSSLPSSSL